MSDIIDIEIIQNSLDIVLVPITSPAIDITLAQGSPTTYPTTYTWNQTVPLAIWTIPHNLNRFPSVMVVDGLNQQIVPDVTYIDQTTLRITHGSPLTGKAYLN